MITSTIPTVRYALGVTGKDQQAEPGCGEEEHGPLVDVASHQKAATIQ